jgi:hypothetical protein
MTSVKLRKNLLRGLKLLIAAAVVGIGRGQKGAVFVLIFYSCQKIRVFGVKKMIYQSLLRNNILYLHN